MGIALPSTLSTVRMYVAYCITDRESVRLANKRCVKRSRQYKTRYLQLTNQKAFISTADQSESLYFYSWSIRKPLFLQLINQKADVNKQPTNQKAYISRRPIDSMDNYSWPIRMPVYLQLTNQKASIFTANQSESMFIYSRPIKKQMSRCSRPIRKHGTFTSDQSDSPYLLNVDGFDHNLSRVCVVAFLLLLLLLINQVVLKYKKYNHLQ